MQAKTWGIISTSAGPEIHPLFYPHPVKINLKNNCILKQTGVAEK
jgi:hypothetical protein